MELLSRSTKLTPRAPARTTNLNVPPTRSAAAGSVTVNVEDPDALKSTTHTVPVSPALSVTSFEIVVVANVEDIAAVEMGNPPIASPPGATTFKARDLLSPGCS